MNMKCTEKEILQKTFQPVEVINIKGFHLFYFSTYYHLLLINSGYNGSIEYKMNDLLALKTYFYN